MLFSFLIRLIFRTFSLVEILWTSLVEAFIGEGGRKVNKIDKYWHHSICFNLFTPQTSQWTSSTRPTTASTSDLRTIQSKLRLVTSQGKIDRENKKQNIQGAFKRRAWFSLCFNEHGTQKSLVIFCTSFCSVTSINRRPTARARRLK